MKILRLTVGGFGGIRGEYRFDPDCLTLVVDDNERGKSTLLAAIAAGLYGLDGDRRTHRVITPLERWRPWDNGVYRLQLELESRGERFTITRDFEQGHVEVWDQSGRERTAEFRDGKDGFPVGKRLIGLDAEEFEKCALIRHGELEQVVAGDERSRRISTLHARLENAADTGGGDTNASEALRALEAAAAHYTCPELGSTLKIDTAILRLETKRELLETRLHEIANDLAGLAEPLETLARLTEAIERNRHALMRVEIDRNAARATEIQGQLDRDQKRKAELDRLATEVAGLEPWAGTPAKAESELRETLAQWRETRRNLDALLVKWRENESNRERLAERIRSLSTYDACRTEDAHRLDARGAELRRLDQERELLRAHRNTLREELIARGWNLERAELLATRFRGLAFDHQELLRYQTMMALSAQAERSAIEHVVAGSSARLSGIRAHRRGRGTLGWIILALGLAIGASGWASRTLRHEQRLWTPSLVLGGALALALIGLVRLIYASRMRRDEYRAAKSRLGEARSRSRQLDRQRAENDERLTWVGELLGYEDTADLVRDWSLHTRLSEEALGLQRLDQRLEELDQQRQTLAEEIAPVVERAGGGRTDPKDLERSSAAIRELMQARERLAAEEKSWSWLSEEKRASEAAIDELTERAAGILTRAGLDPDPSIPWPDQLEALTERSRRATRHGLLVQERIPQLESQLLAPSAREDLIQQLQVYSDGASPHHTTAAGSTLSLSLAELESEISRLRRELDELTRQRAELGPSIEHQTHLAHTQRLEAEIEHQALTRAWERARRFKASLDLASETIRRIATGTHRRWAEFLNRRVGELIRAVGTQVQEVRFGEDLDFSVKLEDHRQVARGKALLQLSSGARDQLHLAVRLAISEFLSRGGEPLPLLIDDCFATSDDGRARAGMRLLIEHLSRQHQIVVVTCHRRRHETLAALDPELYARRVRWLEAREAIVQ